jgi:hypothetical protein
MPPDDSFEAAVEHLRQLYDRQFGFAAPLREVVLCDEGGRELRLPVAGTGGAAKALPPVEAAIVAALTQAGKSLKATAICLKGGMTYSPYIYRVLKRMQRKGLVEPDPTRPAHYRLVTSPK